MYDHTNIKGDINQNSKMKVKLSGDDTCADFAGDKYQG